MCCLHFLFQDPHVPRGLYRNDLICDILCQIWYGDKLKSDAIVHPEYFNGVVPLVTVAFIVTAVSDVTLSCVDSCITIKIQIECALDEWETGVLKKIKFDAKTYETVFDRHLQNLRAWAQYSSTRTQAADNFQMELYKEAS